MALLAALTVLAGLASMQPSEARNDMPSIPIEIEGVDEHGALVLHGGGKLCLQGLWIPEVSALRAGSSDRRSAWHRTITNIGLHHRTPPSSRDRYGCSLAGLRIVEDIVLEQALVENGLVAVEPVSMMADDVTIDALLAAEDEARRVGRGIWRSTSILPKRPDELQAWIGTRQIVEGWVRRVSDNDRYLYLNFGDDWRTDFTVRLRRKLADANGLDRRRLDGRKLRVRGVLQESRGPLIDISHPKQIEFLP